jgi:hypothetical protein
MAQVAALTAAASPPPSLVQANAATTTTTTDPNTQMMETLMKVMSIRLKQEVETQEEEAKQ